MRLELFDELESEWAQLNRSPSSRRALTRWAAEDPDLRGFSDLASIIRFARDQSHPRESDDVLIGLVRRAAHDDLAARCLLQCMIPGLIHLTWTYQGAGVNEDELATMVAGAAYERIRTYPLGQRPRKVAANVLFDTMQRVSRQLFRKHVDEVLMAEPRAVEDSDPVVSSSEELLHLLEEARASGLLSADDIKLIAATRVAGYEFAELAPLYAKQPDTLQKRRYRAERTLAERAGASLG